MTPPATAAARSVARAAPGSRRAAVRHPRRISGPARPVRAAAVAAAVAVPAPGIALPRQRPVRPAQPLRRPARRTTRRPLRGAPPGIALRAVEALEGISTSAALDRLIRGRVWIGLLAFALIGIVAMQLLVLELNTGIGRTLTRVAQLQRANAQLGIENSTYSAEGRIAPLASATGMALAPVGTIHFVAASPADVSRAAAALSTAVQAPSSASPSSTTTTSTTTSGGGEAAGESSESSSTASPGTSASASAPATTEGASTTGAASTTASTPTSAAGTEVAGGATTQGSGSATQGSGASSAPSSEGGAPSREASGAGGGTPAGPRE